MSEHDQSNAGARMSPSTPMGMRLAQFWARHIWLIVGVLWIIALILAYFGFARHATATGQSHAPLDLAYLTLQLISMNSGAVPPPVPWQLQISRFVIPLLAAWTVVRALATVFHDRWQQFLVRTVWREHVVIRGLSRKGWLLARGFADQGCRVVVIESDEDNDLVAACRERGLPALLGDATAADLLQRAAARPQHVVAVTDDGINAKIAARAQELLRQRSDSGGAQKFASRMQIRVVDGQPLCRCYLEQTIVGRNKDQWRQLSIDKSLIGSQRRSKLYRVIGL